jgi:perosamine synthetase
MRATELAIKGGPRAVSAHWERDWPLIGDEEIEAVVDLMKRRVLSIYDRSGIIAEFEDSFADYHTRGPERPYAVAHNSGTSALHAAYFGLGLRPGDEVIVPTYTFLATVVPLLNTGAVPVFADMDEQTLNADPAAVAQLISPRTRAIVVTHMWGHPADMEALCRLGEESGLPIVEDCSHAHGATINGRKVGTFGTVACFSLEGHKPIVAGEGGALVTWSREIYERVLMLGHFGKRIKDEVADPALLPFVQTGFGHKYRMHPLAAAIANQQIRRLDGRNAQRARNLELLADQLSGVPGVQPPRARAGTTYGGWYGFKVRYDPAQFEGLPLQRFLAALQAEGVQAKVPGSPPLHSLPLFSLTATQARQLALPWADFLPPEPRAVEPCPVADAVYPTLMSLPTFSGSDCDEVIVQYGEAFAKVASSWKELI